MNSHVSGGSTSFSPTRPDHMPTVFVTYENGTIFKWDGATPDSPVLISPPQGRHVLWRSVPRIPDTNRVVAAYSIEDGSLDITELVSGLGPPLAAVCRLQAGNPTDTVASFHACLVELDGMGTLMIAAATEAGVISLWDGTTSSCIALLEEPHGAVSALRLCPASRKPCMACGAPPHLLFSFSEYFSPQTSLLQPFLRLHVARAFTTHHHNPRLHHGVTRSGFPHGIPVLHRRLLCSPHARVIRGQHIVPYIRARRSIASCVRERFAASRRGVRHACGTRKQIGRTVGPPLSAAYTRPLALARGRPGRGYDV
ncbi:hypothetical protein EDB92DRAFT_83451 [Lactarius akahatsu]|uniref:Uncharacterized protein n=1 Tax=Lactarius akahatsu TaxID=416441 RepID=A0AAD4QI91_9AGAM|nr:hypothetical protein EDB92DRAFT_83451 [Lactarius akahatsu]